MYVCHNVHRSRVSVLEAFDPLLLDQSGEEIHRDFGDQGKT